jgi:hypothetical protein
MKQYIFSKEATFRNRNIKHFSLCCSSEKDYVAAKASGWTGRADRGTSAPNL